MATGSFLMASLMGFLGDLRLVLPPRAVAGDEVHRSPPPATTTSVSSSVPGFDGVTRSRGGGQTTGGAAGGGVTVLLRVSLAPPE